MHFQFMENEKDFINVKKTYVYLIAVEDDFLMYSICKLHAIHILLNWICQISLAYCTCHILIAKLCWLYFTWLCLGVGAVILLAKMTFLE